jgi:hypothetical protein
MTEQHPAAVTTPEVLRRRILDELTTTEGIDPEVLGVLRDGFFDRDPPLSDEEVTRRLKELARARAERRAQ